MLIVIAHAIILPAYAITALLSPRGAIDHRSRAVCGGNQPASQRLNLQIYGGILLRSDFCGIRRSRSRWHPPWYLSRSKDGVESWTMLHAQPGPRTMVKSRLVGEPNWLTPDVPQTATRESNSGSSSGNGSGTTSVTLRSRLRHLILSRPFRVLPFRACFRIRPSPRFCVPRGKPTPRTLLDPHLPEEMRTGVPTRWCKQKRIEIQIGTTCMKLDRRCSRFSRITGKLVNSNNTGVAARPSRSGCKKWLQEAV